MSSEPLAVRWPHRAGIVAEFAGTALLSAFVTAASALAVERSADRGLQLLEVAAVSAIGLFVLIRILGPVSGAHFNPIVTLTAVVFKGCRWPMVAWYVPVQVLAAAAGAGAASLSIGEPLVGLDVHPVTPGRLVIEAVATAGLVVFLVAIARLPQPHSGPVYLVAYFGAAVWFSGAVGCGNPALTVAQWAVGPPTLSGSLSTLTVLAAQFVGGTVIGLSIAGFLYHDLTPQQAAAIVVRPTLLAYARDDRV